MPTLKEIKGRIASVRGTLKITSAMKLVSSAKLHKAQKAIEAMRPYEAALRGMLEVVVPGAVQPASVEEEASVEGRTAFVAVASNSSLCGGFNAAAVARVRALRRSGDAVYSVGRKMAESMARDGFPSPEDYSALSEHPSYAGAAALLQQLQHSFLEGGFDRVVLVYNHFVSTAKQVPVAEVLFGKDSSCYSEQSEESLPSSILEPSRAALVAALQPRLLKLRLYAALLDSAAAEHAARTVAMQTATDNAEKLLQELTLQYNKGRQQKITSEILDLAGGQARE